MLITQVIVPKYAVNAIAYIYVNSNNTVPQTVKTSNKANITILYQHLTNTERGKKVGS